MTEFTHSTRTPPTPPGKASLSLASYYGYEDSGRRYEDVYGGYLGAFKKLALDLSPSNTVIYDCPLSWLPLVWYMGYKVMSTVTVWDTCNMIQDSSTENRDPSDAHFTYKTPAFLYQVHPSKIRNIIEVLCSLRPETVDALWKYDVQWGVVSPHHVPSRDFFVTCNGSFSRPEVLEYMKALWAFVPTKNKCVIVPCAADKPYPSPLHKMVLDILPDDYHVMNATGVLGIVPQELWEVMPYYDSGIPNEWRLKDIASRYFSMNSYEHIIVLADYYSLALLDAFYSWVQNSGKGSYQLMEVSPSKGSRASYIIKDLTGVGNTKCRIDFINPIVFYPDYIDLMPKVKNVVEVISNYSPN